MGWQKNHSKKINYKKHQPGRLKCVCLMTSWILLDSVLATRWRLLKMSFKRSRAENNALIKLFSWLKFPLIWHFVTKVHGDWIILRISRWKISVLTFSGLILARAPCLFSDPLISIYNNRQYAEWKKNQIWLSFCRF